MSEPAPSGPGPFLRGLTIGVLVGAALAGSQLLRRFLAGRRRSRDT